MFEYIQISKYSLHTGVGLSKCFFLTYFFYLLHFYAPMDPVQSYPAHNFSSVPSIATFLQLILDETRVDIVTALYFITLHCTGVLNNSVQPCTEALHYTALYCTALERQTAPHCTRWLISAVQRRFPGLVLSRLLSPAFAEIRTKRRTPLLLSPLHCTDQPGVRKTRRGSPVDDRSSPW